MKVIFLNLMKFSLFLYFLLNPHKTRRERKALKLNGRNESDLFELFFYSDHLLPSVFNFTCAILFKKFPLNKKVVFDSFKTSFNYLLFCFPVWCLCVHIVHKNVCSMPINGIKITQNCYFPCIYVVSVFCGVSELFIWFL